MYRPLEFLFTVAAFTTLIENFLPQLIALPKVSLPLCAQWGSVCWTAFKVLMHCVCPCITLLWHLCI